MKAESPDGLKAGGPWFMFAGCGRSRRSLASEACVIVLWTIESVSDECPDRDASNLEGVHLEVDLDRPMVGVCGLGVEFDAVLVQAQVALECYLVLEAGDDDIAVPDYPRI